MKFVLAVLFMVLVGQFVHAQEPLLAEIRIFTGNFAPRNWAFCNGQILPIAQNTALFSLLGTTYGGNGQTTFALPDLRGRLPVHFGQGPGLTNRDLGEQGGSESVTLLSTQMPAHTHAVNAATGSVATQNSPTNNLWGKPALLKPYSSANADTTMHAQSIGVSGGSQPHANMPPFLAVNYIIALAGIFPSRS